MGTSFNVLPSAVLQSELDNGQRFSNMFGCNEFEIVAKSIVEYLAAHGDSWIIALPLTDLSNEWNLNHNHPDIVGRLKHEFCPEYCQNGIVTTKFISSVLRIPQCERYQYTQNWTEPFIVNATRHLVSLKDRPLKYLEIGVFEGRSLCWMAEHVLLHPDSFGVGIDTWPNSDEFARAEHNCGQHQNLKWIRSNLTREACNFPAEHFDIIYIDGDHLAIPVMTDTVLAWQLLKPGGIMIWDDTGWNHPHFQVPEVIDWFLPRVPHRRLDAKLQAWAVKMPLD